MLDSVLFDSEKARYVMDNNDSIVNIPALVDAIDNGTRQDLHTAMSISGARDSTLKFILNCLHYFDVEDLRRISTSSMNFSILPIVSDTIKTNQNMISLFGENDEYLLYAKSHCRTGFPDSLFPERGYFLIDMGRELRSEFKVYFPHREPFTRSLDCKVYNSERLLTLAYTLYDYMKYSEPSWLHRIDRPVEKVRGLDARSLIDNYILVSEIAKFYSGDYFMDIFEQYPVVPCTIKDLLYIHSTCIELKDTKVRVLLELTGGVSGELADLPATTPILIVSDGDKGVRLLF